MKFMPLIWSGIARSPARAILLLVQIAVAFVLFGLLQGMNEALKQAVSKARADVLYVNSRVQATPLPLHYLDEIEAIDGVETVNPQNFLVGEYQRPTQQVIAVATDPERYFAINDYCSVPTDALRALTRTRNGAIAGAELARQHGWKVGDRVGLATGTAQKDGSPSWTFDVVGIYEYPEEPDMATLLIVRNDYFDQSRVTTHPNTVVRFVVKVTNARVAARIMRNIDDMFANSSHETATTQEDASAQNRLRSMGDLDFVTRTVTAAAFFALLLSVGTTLMNSIRRRTPELAVLKALGFADRFIVGIIFAEVLALCTAAATLGLAIAWGLMPLAREYAGLVEMPLNVVALGLGLAAFLALVCAYVPAKYAMKLRVVEALAKH